LRGRCWCPELCENGTRVFRGTTDAFKPNDGDEEFGAPPCLDSTAKRSEFLSKRMHYHAPNTLSFHRRNFLKARAPAICPGQPLPVRVLTSSARASASGGLARLSGREHDLVQGRLRLNADAGRNRSETAANVQGRHGQNGYAGWRGRLLWTGPSRFARFSIAASAEIK